MSEWVKAQVGDTLCSIAVSAGFPNCQPLRDHPSNAAIKDRQLKLNDDVFVPDLAGRVEDGGTEATHTFLRPGIPVAQIRFVHGGPDNAMAAEPDLDFLNVSNYRTEVAGVDSTDAFAGPDRWRF